MGMGLSGSILWPYNPYTDTSSPSFSISSSQISWPYAILEKLLRVSSSMMVSFVPMVPGNTNR